MLIPRDYQKAAVDSIYEHFSANYTGNPLIAAPTGVGKSVIIANFLESIYKHWPNQKVIIATHVKELVEQNHAKLMLAWPQAPAGIYSAGLRKKESRYPITFANIQSIAKKANLFGHVDLLIVDEAHRVDHKKGTTYTKFIEELKKVNPNLKVIGLTATDYRTGYGYIWGKEDSIFERKCIDLCTMECFNWFIDQGYLINVIPRRGCVEVNTDNIKVVGGDFNQKELEVLMNHGDITERAINQCVEECGQLDSWLVFASGVEHAKNIVDMLEMKGISASAVYSGMEKDGLDREDVIARFKSGEIQALVNNNVLTTGFDHPGIKLIVALRPTMSVSLWVQMVGRGTRPNFAEGFDLSTQEGRLLAIKNSDKQFCYVYDYSNNTRRLGPINDPKVPNKRKGKGGEAPIKECPQCGTLNHPKIVNCIYCGHEFTFEVKITENATNDQIIVDDLPLIQDFPVRSIQYSVNAGRNGKKDTIKVLYQTDLGSFVDIVCLDHPKDSFPHKIAREWWRRRFLTAIPESVESAMNIIETGMTPTHIRVHLGTAKKKIKYPDIKAYCFDGSNFGKEEPREISIKQEKTLSISQTVNRLLAHDPNDEESVPF